MTTLLSPADSVAFWPPTTTASLPFVVPVMRFARASKDQRGRFPGRTPEWGEIAHELSLARSGYVRRNDKRDGRSLEILCGRLVVGADMKDNRHGAARLWLSGAGTGIRFAGNIERRKFAATGYPVRHQGIWVGTDSDFHAAFERDPFYGKGSYAVEAWRTLMALEEQRAPADAHPERALGGRHNPAELGLLTALDTIIDADYEVEQRLAQQQASFHFYSAQPTTGRSTIKRYFRLSFVEGDYQRLADAQPAIKVLAFENDEGARLLLEIADVAAGPGPTDVVVTSARQVATDDLPPSGALTVAASHIQHNARKRAVEQLRTREARNAWLVALAARAYAPPGFATRPFEPPPGDFAPNPSQREAIAKGLATPDYTLVLGPPGTGKTTVIYSWVEQFVEQGKRVLITSQGNRAVDNVLTRIAHDKKFTCVRLGNESKLSAGVRELLLDNCAAELQATIASSIVERSAGMQRVLAQYDRMLEALARTQDVRTLVEELRACRALTDRELAPLRTSLDLGAGSAWEHGIDALEQVAGRTGAELALQNQLASRRGLLRFWYLLRSYLHERKAARLHAQLTAERQALLELAQRQRARLEQVVRIVGAWHEALAKQRQQGLYPLLLSLVDVVGATCIGIDTNRHFEGVEFDVVIVDEAGQIQLHNLAVPMAKGAQVILVGDHKQLPPVVTDDFQLEVEERSKLLEQPIELDVLRKSWFELMWSVTPADRKVMLDTQFRCPSVISDFISEAFYEGKYFAGEPMKKKRPLLPEFASTMVFIDTSGLPPRERNEQRKPDQGVTGNQQETELVLSVLHYFTSRLPELLENNEVGIIAPLNNHVEEIRRELARWKKRGQLSGPISPTELAASVDSYQGQERDLMIHAFTRSNARNRVGFLKDWRRLNVAMTRAKRQLVMIGDLATLTGDSGEQEDAEYKQAMRVLVRHLQTRGEIIDAVDWWRVVRGTR